ncbi:MAG TPA: VWA domain-containing protein [Terriglobales bacterium]|nr:VWA domain-containing protein [Terriglobales bacterium]
MSEGIGWRYALTHLGDLGIAWLRPELLWCFGVVVLLLFRVWRAGNRDAGRWLRAAALTAVGLALCGMQLTASLPDHRLALVAVVDHSESIDADGRDWQRRHLEEIARALAPQDRLSVLLFGASQRLLPSGELPRRDRSSEIDTGASDIAAALDRGFALAGGSGLARILLLSDGHETRGAAAERVAQAKHDGIAIFTAAPPHAGGIDAAIEKITMPAVITSRTLFPIQVTVRNQGRPRSLSLGLYVDGAPVGREELPLQAGLNAIEIPYRIERPGTYAIEARLEIEADRIEGNNRLANEITVVGQLRLLLLTPHSHSPLQLSLERQGVAVRTRDAKQPGRLADELADVHAVALEDITAADLSAGDGAALERFVRDRGGALLFAGGEQSYGDAKFQGSAIERLLPVTLEPYRPRRPQRPPIGLFLVIDRSNSMGYHFARSLERSEGESKLVYARRAALAVLAQLKSNDLIGVIAFDAAPHELAPLQRVADSRTQLHDAISRLRPEGGTDFYDALEAAVRQLGAAQVANRHVILLTDGDTNRSEGHEKLIDRIVAADVSVTTIRVGDDRANLHLLTTIAERSGGEFYHVENVASLPELMLRDTANALGRMARQGEVYRPRLASASQLLTGLAESDLPDLYGYAYAKAKPGADVLLEVATQDRSDPLLAVWQLGLGRVVAFTASPNDDAGAWIGWDRLGKFWSQTVRWAAPEHAGRDYALRARRSDSGTMLEVGTFADNQATALWARVHTGLETRIDMPLAQVAPRRFRARLPELAGGLYRVSIVERLGEQQVGEQSHTVRIPHGVDAAREERYADKPNLALLRYLAAETGGELNAPIRTLLERPPGSRQAAQPLDWLLVPTAALLLLIEVALRRR